MLICFERVGLCPGAVVVRGSCLPLVENLVRIPLLGLNELGEVEQDVEEDACLPAFAKVHEGHPSLHLGLDHVVHLA